MYSDEDMHRKMLHYFEPITDYREMANAMSFVWNSMFARPSGSGRKFHNYYYEAQSMIDYIIRFNRASGNLCPCLASAEEPEFQRDLYSLAAASEAAISAIERNRIKWSSLEGAKPRRRQNSAASSSTALTVQCRLAMRRQANHRYIQPAAQIILQSNHGVTRQLSSDPQVFCLSSRPNSPPAPSYSMKVVGQDKRAALNFWVASIVSPRNKCHSPT